MLYVSPPFELGQTLTGTDPNDSTNLINDDKCGMVYFFPANRLSTANIRSSKTRLTGKGITAVVLRNTAGIYLLPKRLVQLGTGWDSTHGNWGFETATGYTYTLADRCVVVDPFLPTAGVLDNDLFWGFIGGYCICYKGTADTAADVTAGNPVVAATLNSTSGNSTCGCIDNITLPGQTGATQAFSMAANLVGYAVTTRVTNTTASDVLVDLCIRY